MVSRHKTNDSGGAGRGPNCQASILLIDDDSDMAAALGRVLSNSGYQVRHASDGEEGVRLAKQQRPDVILLDWMMPVKNGFEACQEMRQVESLRDVPIVVLTAFGQHIGEIYGLGGDKAGYVQDCLEKPVEINVLLERLAMALHAAGRTGKQCPA